MPTHLEVMRCLADEYYDIVLFYIDIIKKKISSFEIDNILEVYSDDELPKIKKEKTYLIF